MDDDWALRDDDWEQRDGDWGDPVDDCVRPRNRTGHRLHIGRGCPKCQGRLRVLAVITERPQIARILEHLDLPTEAMPLARARDPTEDEYAEDAGAPPQQRGLELALPERAC